MKSVFLIAFLYTSTILAQSSLHAFCVLDLNRELISVFDTEGVYLGTLPDQIEEVEEYVEDNCDEFTSVENFFLPNEFSGKFSTSIDSKTIGIEVEADWEKVRFKQYSEDGQVEEDLTYSGQDQIVDSSSVVETLEDGSKNHLCAYRVGYAEFTPRGFQIVEKVYTVDVNYLDSFVCWRRTTSMVREVGTLIYERKGSLTMTVHKDMVLVISEVNVVEQDESTTSVSLFRQ